MVTAHIRPIAPFVLFEQVKVPANNDTWYHEDISNDLMRRLGTHALIRGFTVAPSLLVNRCPCRNYDDPMVRVGVKRAGAGTAGSAQPIVRNFRQHM